MLQCMWVVGRLATVGLLLLPSMAMADHYVSNQLLVRFNSGATVACRDSAIASVLGSIVDSVSVASTYVVEIPDTSVQAKLATIRGFSCVAYSTPNNDEVETLLTPNDSLWSQLWHLNNTGQSGGTTGADIDAVLGWNFIHESPNVIIAVLDKGIDITQPDLQNNIFTNTADPPGNGDEDLNLFTDDYHGWDFYNNDNTPEDDPLYSEHGTPVASVLGAQGNNSIGLTGVTWRSKILPVKVIQGNFAPASAIANGIAYADMMGAKIINCSFRAPFDITVRNAINVAESHGVLIVCAAGNSGTNNDVAPVYPASYSNANIISVTETDRYDQLDALGHTCSSGEALCNYGATSVDLAGPGCDFCVAFPGSYHCGHSGTSLSSPTVAGAAALLWAQHPTWTAADVKSRLMVTVDTLSSLSSPPRVASKGRLNIARALDNIPPSPVSFTYERGHHSVKVMWTETGDDTTDGTATVAAIRWSTSTPLNNETAFNGATPIPLDIPLAGSGTEHCIVFTDLTANHTYYVAVKLEDGEFNWSSIGSGSVSTLGSGNFEVEECPVINRPAEARTPVRPTDTSTLVWALESARPNPTNGNSSIDYSMKVGGPVKIGIYNVAGRLVRMLVDETQTSGIHTVVWDGTASDGSRVGGGVYFYRMIANGWQSDRRLVVLGE